MPLLLHLLFAFGAAMLALIIWCELDLARSMFAPLHPVRWRFHWYSRWWATAEVRRAAWALVAWCALWLFAWALFVDSIAAVLAVLIGGYSATASIEAGRRV